MNPLLDSVSGDAASSYNGNENAPDSTHDSSAPKTPADADLRAVVEAWPGLPAAIREGIIAMVRATGR